MNNTFARLIKTLTTGVAQRVQFTRKNPKLTQPDAKHGTGAKRKPAT